MEKIIINGIAILLTMIGLAGLYYNYHVEVNLLLNKEWSHFNLKLIFLPLFYAGSFWLLNLAILDRLDEVITFLSSSVEANKTINQRLLAKLFMIALVYIGLATFAWAAISDAQYLLNKNT